MNIKAEIMKLIDLNNKFELTAFENLDFSKFSNLAEALNALKSKAEEAEEYWTLIKI